MVLALGAGGIAVQQVRKHVLQECIVLIKVGLADR